MRKIVPRTFVLLLISSIHAEINPLAIKITHLIHTHQILQKHITLHINNNQHLITLSEFIQPLCEIEGALSNLPDTELLCSFLLTFQKIKENSLASLMPPRSLASSFSPPSSFSFLKPSSNITFTVDYITSLLSVPTSERMMQLIQPVLRFFLARYIPSQNATLLSLLSAFSNSLPPLIASYVIQILDQSFSPLSSSPVPSSPLYPTILSGVSPSFSPSSLLHDLESACEGFLYLSRLSSRSPNQATVFPTPNDPASLRLRLCDKIKHWSPPGRISPLHSLPLSSPPDFSSLFFPPISSFSPPSPILSFQFHKPDILSILYSMEKRRIPLGNAATFGDSFERFCHSIEILHLSLYAGIAVLPSLRSSLFHFAPSSVYSLLPRVIDTTVLSFPIIPNTPLSVWTPFFYPVSLATVAEKIGETLRIYSRVLNAISLSAFCYMPSQKVIDLVFFLQSAISSFKSISEEFFFQEQCTPSLPSLGCLNQVTPYALRLARILLESNVENSLAVFGACPSKENQEQERDGNDYEKRGEKRRREERNERNSLFLSLENFQTIPSPRSFSLSRYLLFTEMELKELKMPKNVWTRKRLNSEIRREQELEINAVQAKIRREKALRDRKEFWVLLANDRMKVDGFLLNQKFIKLTKKRYDINKNKFRKPKKNQDKKDGMKEEDLGTEDMEMYKFMDERGEKEEEEWEKREEKKSEHIEMEDKIEPEVRSNDAKEEVGDTSEGVMKIEEDEDKRKEKREGIWNEKRGHIMDSRQWNALYKDKRWRVVEPYEEWQEQFFEPQWRSGRTFKHYVTLRKKNNANRINNGHQEHTASTREHAQSDRTNKSFCHSCQVERDEASGERELRFWSLATAPLSSISVYSTFPLPSSSASLRYAALINDALEWNEGRERLLIVESLMPTQMHSSVLRRYSDLLSGTGSYHDLRWKHHLTETTLRPFLSAGMRQLPKKKDKREEKRRKIAMLKTEPDEELKMEVMQMIEGTWSAPIESSDVVLAEHFIKEFEKDTLEREERESRCKYMNKHDKFTVEAEYAPLLQYLEELTVVCQREAEISQVREKGKYLSLWDAHHNFLVAFLELLLFRSYNKFVQARLPSFVNKVIIYQSLPDQSASLPASLFVPIKKREYESVDDQRKSGAMIREMEGELKEMTPDYNTLKVFVSLDKQERFARVIQFLRPYFRALVKKSIGKRTIQWIRDDQIRVEANASTVKERTRRAKYRKNAPKNKSMGKKSKKSINKQNPIKKEEDRVNGAKMEVEIKKQEEDI